MVSVLYVQKLGETKGTKLSAYVKIICIIYRFFELYVHNWYTQNPPVEKLKKLITRCVVLEEYNLFVLHIGCLASFK